MANNRATDFRRAQDPLSGMLNWGLANSDANAAPVDPQRSREHVELLEKVMAGQISDAERMKAAVIIINDQETNLDERLEAWDQLEMLVESLDNANDLKPLNLWGDIVRHFHSEEPQVVVQALWVAGTAVQNNPKAQDEFLSTNPIPTLINLIQSTSSVADIRSKAIYTLGSATKHNESAVATFVDAHGWKALEFALQDPIIACRRKAAFLADSIFQNAANISTILTSARETKIIEILVQSTTPNALPFGPDGDQTGDADLTEKAISAILNLCRSAGKGALTSSEKSQLREALENKEADEVGLAQSELDEFKQFLA